MLGVKMFVVKRDNGRTFAVPAKELVPKLNQTSRKIVALLAKEPTYPKEISRRLSLNEQKIYYNIRQLEKQGLIIIDKRVDAMGAVAKIYKLASPAFVWRFAEFEEAPASLDVPEFLEPFISGGRLDASVVMGSPEPHGPESARSRDAYYSLDFMLFLGRFVSRLSGHSIKLDTDVKPEDLKGNLIVIGGPVTNKLTAKLNERLLIGFDKNKNIVSKISRRKYQSDSCGFIVRQANPYQRGRQMLVLAGKRYTGTRAAILAFIQNFDGVCKPNKHGRNKRQLSHVVEGFDKDSDGILETVEFRE